jgi:hypothetical protein
MSYYIHMLAMLATNAMIVVMLFWILFWDTEPSNAIRRYWIPRIQAPFIWLGLNAEWRMFAFDPPRRDLWPMVTMTLANGSVMNWEPSPFAELSVRQKRRFKKLHKYYYTVVGLSTGKQLHRDFVEHILRQCPQDHPCMKVELYSVVQDAPALGSTGAAAQPQKKLIFTFHPYVGDGQ